MKYFASLLMLALFARAALADSTAVTATNAAGLVNQILTVPAYITSITINNPSAAGSTTVRLFDLPGTALTFSRGIFTNYTPTVIIRTNSWVDVFGKTATNFITVVTNVAAGMPATNYAYRTFGDFLVPFGESVSINYPIPTPALFGLGFTNGSSNAVVSVQYFQ